MDVVLIPGFWLDGDSWRDVAPRIRGAGHIVHALTLPGRESVDLDRSRIGLSDQVSAVVALIDAIPGPVALVGHSGGGSVASVAADRRPEHVAQVIYVDSGPLGDGDSINAELPAEGSDVPLPDWSTFWDVELVGFTDELKERFRREAVPEPVAVTRDRVRLTNVRRYDMPSTIITCTMPATELQQRVDSGDPYAAEFARMRRRAILELPTGHWPQFTRPDDLAATILEALAHRP